MRLLQAELVPPHAQSRGWGWGNGKRHEQWGYQTLSLQRVWPTSDHTSGGSSPARSIATGGKGGHHAQGHGE